MVGVLHTRYGDNSQPLFDYKLKNKIKDMRLYQQPKEVILRALGLPQETTDKELNKEILRLQLRIKQIEGKRLSPL